MIYPLDGSRITVVVPDGLGPLVPLGVSADVPWATDITYQFAIKHSDGTPYVLTSTTFQVTWKRDIGQTSPTLARQADVQNANLGYCSVTTDTNDAPVLLPYLYFVDGIFTDSSGSSAIRDESVLPSRINVYRTVGRPGDPVTVPVSSPPLAIGPRGYPTTYGTFNHLTTYQLGQGATYSANGVTSFYLHTGVSSTGVLPTDTSQWSLIASGSAAGSGNFTIDSNGAVGDVVVFDTTGSGLGLRTLSGGLFSVDETIFAGVLLQSVTAGNSAQVATGNITLSPAVTGFNGSDAGPIAVDTDSLSLTYGRLISIPLTSSAIVRGYCNAAGTSFLLSPIA